MKETYLSGCFKMLKINKWRKYLQNITFYGYLIIALSTFIIEFNDTSFTVPSAIAIAISQLIGMIIIFSFLYVVGLVIERLYKIINS